MYTEVLLEGRRLVNEAVQTTAATPSREVEAVVRFPTNMAAAKIGDADFNK